MPLNVVRFIDSRSKSVVLEFEAHGLRFKDVQGGQGAIKAGVKALDLKLKALELGIQEARVALGDENSRDKRVRLTGVLRGLLKWWCGENSVDGHR